MPDAEHCRDIQLYGPNCVPKNNGEALRSLGYEVGHKKEFKWGGGNLGGHINTSIDIMHSSIVKYPYNLSYKYKILASSKSTDYKR